MKREIKFRAWDGKKMHHNAIVGNGQVLFIPDATGEYKWHSRADVAPMQYTGLKDKNRVEIYDGDIVKSESGSNICQIFFGNHTFMLSGFPVSCNELVVLGWMAKNIKTGVIDVFDESLCGEVIGNIYENADLIKTT